MVTAIKKNFLTFGLFLVHCCGALTTQELFLRGNKAYKEGLYQDALAEYNEIKSPTWALYLNKGNCHYALGNYAEALLEWRRAYPQADSKQRYIIEQQSAHAREHLSLVQSSVSEESILGRVPLVAQQVVILFLLLMAALMIRLLSVQGKLKGVLYGGFITTIVFCGAYVFLYRAPQLEGIVVKSGPLIIGNDPTLPSCGTLQAGELVSLAAHRDGWYKVQHAEQIGWIQEEHVRIV